MKVLIAIGAALLGLTAPAYASPSVCLSQHQSEFIADPEESIYQVTQVNDTDVRVAMKNNPERFWVFRLTGEQIPARQARKQCQSLIEEFHRARMAVALQGLKERHPLAVVLLLQIGMSQGSTSRACSLINDSKVLAMIDGSDANSPLGQKILFSGSLQEPVLLEHSRGLVYQTMGCTMHPKPVR